jgi:hypothetical protein
MNKRIINEGLDYHDLEGQMEPTVSVDEYAAKMGKDSDVVTLAFIVNSEAAGDDLVNWFERGYDWILDASISEGQLKPGKYLVFVELKRRTTVPSQIIELIDDLKTLTNIDIKEWTVTVDEEDYEPDAEVLKQVIELSPHDYRVEKEEELNEMRERAGISLKAIHADKQDAELKAFKSMAGL